MLLSSRMASSHFLTENTYQLLVLNWSWDENRTARHLIVLMSFPFEKPGAKYNESRGILSPFNRVKIEQYGVLRTGNRGRMRTLICI